jgi:hypothetical protein
MAQETVAVAWCDNGDVDGKFMQGVTDVLLKSGVKFETSIRSQGNQIARQREKVIKFWYEQNLSEWLLWVDSDIVLSPENFLKLWDKKDKVSKPLLTGVYFTTDNPEEPLMVPMPTIYSFAELDGGLGIKRVHPLPKDTFMKVEAAGMGFVLMHRSVVTKIMEALPGVPFFTEMGADKAFIGEDIYFFALCGKAEVPLWCDTSALVPHMKRFSFDEHYYKAFFGAGEQSKESNLVLPKRYKKG